MEITNVKLDKIAGGGQAIGTLDTGQKIFVWGGLPGETVNVRVTKKKSKLIEAVVTQIIIPSQYRTEPVDQTSYLSTSPWQIMTIETEQGYKAQLINEAFKLHHITLTEPIDVYSDNTTYGYRNKLEFSWYGDTDTISGVETLDLAFFRRGSKGKVIVEGSSLARPEINQLASEIRDLLRTKSISARQLKTLLIRCDQRGNCVWQLYAKDELPDIISAVEAKNLSAQGGEVIYSNPKSPASVITKRLSAFGDITLTDTILGTPFRYATEGFFQVNIPVYEQALIDMHQWIPGNQSTVDMYSGVGTIGLTIGGDNVTLVEINEHAVREMHQNIAKLHKNATAILAPSEQALDYITTDKIIVVDPPRAGLHQAVIDRLLEQEPPRIIYLSCNPVTQARDVSLLQEKYHIAHTQGYNFFPRTPHIENLIVLDEK